jgi:hypothetical protein
MLIVPALEDGQFGAYQGALRRCALTSPEVSRDHIIDRIDVRRENLIKWFEAKGWPIKGLKPLKSAAREAYEEAGIRSVVCAKSIEKKRPEENGGIINK